MIFHVFSRSGDKARAKRGQSERKREKGEDFLSPGSPGGLIELENPSDGITHAGAVEISRFGNTPQPPTYKTSLKADKEFGGCGFGCRGSLCFGLVFGTVWSSHANLCYTNRSKPLHKPQ